MVRHIGMDVHREFAQFLDGGCCQVLDVPSAFPLNED